MQNIRQTTLVAGVVAAAVLSVAGWAWLNAVQDGRQKEAQRFADRFALRLVERFHETISPAFMMASRVDRKTGAVIDFEENAAELLRDFPLIRAVELAPGGIVSLVHPLRGNELIVGHDLLIDKKRNKEAYQAVSRRQLAVAGPLELMQGGVGAIARYPVFLASTDGRYNFWGFSIVVVDFPALLRVAGEAEFERLGYHYQLCWIPAGETACKTVLGDRGMAEADAAKVKLSISGADWHLAVAPHEGWVTPLEKLLTALSILLGSVLVVVLVHRCLNQRAADNAEMAGLSSPTG